MHRDEVSRNAPAIRRGHSLIRRFVGTARSGLTITVLAAAGCGSGPAASDALLAPATQPLAARKSPEPVRVRFETDLGPMTFDIYEAQAPVTARNFLRYVDEHRFEGASFYRTVTMGNQPNSHIKIAVVQGGLGLSMAGALPPIDHETTEETGIRHLDGTLSMARTAPGTARSEFFICIGDQPELDFGGRRHPDGQGFAAFGRLVAGADIARRIHRQPGMDQMLAHPVRIIGIARTGP